MNIIVLKNKIKSELHIEVRFDAKEYGLFSEKIILTSDKIDNADYYINILKKSIIRGVEFNKKYKFMSRKNLLNALRNYEQKIT